MYAIEVIRVRRDKRYEWSNGRTAYSCRLRRGKWNKLRIVQDIEDCPHWERRKHEKDD